MSATNINAPLVKGPTNGNVKKLVIKPLKLKPQLPDNFEAVTWAKLQDAVHAVLQKRPVSSSLEELYRECDQHIAAQLLKLKENTWREPVAFLASMDVVWQDHCSAMLLLRSIFLYLDRTHVISSASVRSLFDMGLQLFRNHLCRHKEVESRCVEGLLLLIERERMGDSVDRQRVKSLLRMLSSLGLYADSFQRPCLERTTQFYQAEGDRCMQEMDVPDYLVRCETRLAEEYERSQQYLDISTRKPLIQAVEEQLLRRHVGAVLEKGFAALMDGTRSDALARLYTLCSRVAALDALRNSWKDYICKTGIKLVKDEEKDKEMVDNMLALKERLDDLLARAFQNNEQFAHALKEAFETFINSRQNKPAELIAKFIDARLKTGNKGQTDEELEGVLDKALLLFRYISGKDVFEAFYKKDLAKRLLLGKSASIDSEKSMIAKLKAECGAQFTTKMEGMFKDVELSIETMQNFRQSSMARERLPAGIEMGIHVLTSGFWPTYPVMEVKLPQELGTLSQVFHDFYDMKQSGRRLMWQHSLGSCILRAAFPKGSKELSVSLFQAVILMLFNDVDSMTLAEIREATGIEDKELRRNLQSLACGKVRVLTKEPVGRDVKEGDTFHFNQGFSEKLYRIKINTIQLKETEEENKKTNEEVFQDRKHSIEAAIVRIMKTRKTLSHKLLIQETMQQLKFPIRAPDIKKIIESLIERDYLVRDKDDSNVYNYLA